VCLLEEQSCQTSSRSDLKRHSLRFFAELSPKKNKKKKKNNNNNNNKMSSEKGSVPDPKITITPLLIKMLHANVSGCIVRLYIRLHSPEKVRNNEKMSHSIIIPTGSVLYHTLRNITIVS